MKELNAEMSDRSTDETLIFSTICHNGDSHKLYYYCETRRFHCYSNCGSMSIYDLIMKSKQCEFKEAFDLLRDIIGNLDRPFVGFGEIEYVQTDLNEVLYDELPVIDKPYLYKIFKNKPIKEWLEEGISEDAMRKFNIRFDDVKNRAIIPHMNVNGNCIGIRVRNFNKCDIERGKYVPLWHGDKCYSHKLGQCLYGFNVSKENIGQYKKVFIFESEKSVLKYESIYKDNNLAVAICGSSFSNVGKKMLLDCGVTEVILSLDRQYKTEDSEEAIQWKKKIYKMAENLLPYCKVSYIWDTDKDRLLNYKDSPLDAGKTSFEKLVRSRKVII